MRCSLTSFVLVCLVTAQVTAQEAPPAPAELTPEQRTLAQGHFERGSLAYERGDYDQAESEFRAAYDLTRHPDLRYNLYTAQERNGNLEAAAESLEAYLAEADIGGDRRDALALRLERLRLRLEQERANEREEAAREERERAESRAQVEQARVEAAEAQERHLEQLRSGHATADSLIVAGLGTVVAAGALGLTFAVLAGASEAEDQRLAGDCGRDAGVTCRPEDVATLRDLNLAADVMWISALGVGAVGGILLIAGEALRPGGEAETAWLSPVVAPGQVGVVAGGVL